MIEYPTRQAFLESLPKQGRCAEIGVLRGGNSKSILEVCQPIELILVDPWRIPDKSLPYKWARMQQPDLDQMYEGVVNAFSSYPHVKIVRKPSLEAAPTFIDQYFDFVYIDGSHRYDDVLADLEAWLPKIKNNGLLCGHDYDTTDVSKKKGDGVFAAVNDFCNKYDLQVISVSKKPSDQERDFCIQL